MGSSSSGSRGWGGSRSWGSRSSRSSSSPRAWGSRSSSSSYSGGGRRSSIKSSSTLKKVAVLGAGAYSAYKAKKMAKKKKKSKFHIDLDIEEQGDDDYMFNDWDKWRQADGFMCRDDNDCNWLDEDLRCENYEMSILAQRRLSINQGWFGGQALSVVGECHCRRLGQIWDNLELVCAGSEKLLVGILPFFLVFLVNLVQV